MVKKDDGNLCPQPGAFDVMMVPHIEIVIVDERL